MIPYSLRRSIVARGDAGVLQMIPKTFCLNTGHVSFFYDKGTYLRKRYDMLTGEILSRGYDVDPDAMLDREQIFLGLPAEFHKDYEPTDEAIAIVRERIAQRISQRPNWYRYKGKLAG